jgi:pantetheine-phosphate adenylyltransferase
MAIGIYAGTFDLLHNGHIEVLRTAGILPFKKIYWVIGENPKKTPMFSTVDRTGMMLACLDGPLSDIKSRIFIDVYENMYLCDFAHKVEDKEQEPTVIIRGIRNEADAKSELSFHVLNKTWRPHVNTIFIPAITYPLLSSSLIKEMTGPEGWEARVRDLVPDCVFHALHLIVKH